MAFHQSSKSAAIMASFKNFLCNLTIVQVSNPRLSLLLRHLYSKDQDEIYAVSKRKTIFNLAYCFTKYYSPH